MTRRSMLGNLLLGALAGTLPGGQLSAASPRPSSQINPVDERIAALARQITSGERSTRDRAIAVHRWVRDEIRFGLSADFYATTDVDVLRERIGYCNSKVLIFCSLLAAAGLPYRIRFIDLSASVLRGLFSPGTAYVDHAVTEVGLDGAWIATDSYIVDAALESAARERLQQEGATVGYGIHLAGNSDWDGRQASFIQAVPGSGPAGYIARDHGLFLDPLDFYAGVSDARNRRTWVTGLAIRLSAGGINRQIDEIRRRA